ncbi:MAG: hypothetical protein J7513_00190 [Solirubrobacteraceae bacterium]|nr:hypothetical protein [Solirubrobacteraceae bacterium]
MPPGLIAILVALGVLAAGALGYLAGHDSRADAPTTTATALGEPTTFGPLRMSIPVGWEVDAGGVPDGSVLSGLSPIAVRPDVPQSARLLAWLSTGEVNPQLLPLGRIDPASLQAAKPPTTVEFPNGQTALRYEDLRLRRRQSPLTLYVAPTTKGVVTLACPAEYLPQPCDAVATTIAAAGSDPLPVDPDATVADGVRGALSRLGSASEEPAKTLASAKKGGTVADASGDLADAYRAAADSIGAIDAPLGAAVVSFDGVATRLNAVADAYSAIAGAADAGNRNGYDAASKRLTEERKQLELMLTMLRRQGYDIRMPK